MASTKERLDKALAAGALSADTKSRLDRILGGSEPLTASPQKPPGILQRMQQRLLGTDFPDDPASTLRSFGTAGGAIGGALAGAEFGGKAGPLVKGLGTLAGGAAGAATGFISPELGVEIGELTGIVPKGFREELGLLTDEQLKAGAEAEALIDLTLGAGLQFAGVASRPVARFISGSGKEGTRLADEAAKLGVEVPAIATGNTVFSKFFTFVFGRFPFVGSPLKKQVAKSEKQLKTLIEGLPNRLGPTILRTDLGTQIFKDARHLVKQVDSNFKALYGATFKRAKDAGVQVSPRRTLEVAEEVLGMIERERLTFVGLGDPKAGKVLENVAAFVKNEVLPIAKTTKATTTFGPEFSQGVLVGSNRADVPGMRILAKQDLKQMDALLTKIDEEMASLAPGTKRFAETLMGRLKTAVQFDATQNLTGENAVQIGAELRNLDKRFHKTMLQLFETSTANKFGRVRRRGLRGVVAPSKEATTTPIDQLVKIVFDLKSPQGVDELLRLVTPTTKKRLAADALTDAFSKGFVNKQIGGLETQVFDPEKVVKFLELNQPNSPVKKSLSMVLQSAGGPVQMETVEQVLKIAERFKTVPVPDASTFIARKGVIGGLGGAIRGMIPGSALAAGSGFAGGLVGTLIMLGGARGISLMLADPLAARSLRSVLDPTIKTAVKRANFIRAGRAVVNGLVAGGELEKGDIDAAMEMIRNTAAAISRTLTGNESQ